MSEKYPSTDTSSYVTLSKAQLAEMIAEALATERRNNPDIATMGAAIGEAVSTGMAKNARKKVSYGDYVRRPHSTTHTDPNYPNGPSLTRECMVNGDRANTNVLTDREINLLNQVTHSGRYLDRLVEVIVQHNGSEEEVQIRWNCKTADQRFEMAKYGSFATMMEQIIKAQVEEDAENEVVEAEKQSRRQQFGNTRAYREARAKAEAKELADA